MISDRNRTPDFLRCVPSLIEFAQPDRSGPNSESHSSKIIVRAREVLPSLAVISAAEGEG